MTVIVILVVSAALILGAAWGIYGHLSEQLEGRIIGVAGGALMLSAVLDLIEPATTHVSLWAGLATVVVGAAVFAGVDYVVDEIWGSGGGGGLLAAITLDGVPENLALGVALIGAEPMEVAALSGSIFLSNLPEAAGGARAMSAGGQSKRNVFGLWSATALLLSGAALAGRFSLEDAPSEALALIKCFAGGAVVASLATEVFPKAYRDDAHWAGVATAIGLILALYLDQLA